MPKKEKYTFEQYCEECNGAPIEFREFAERALEIADKPTFVAVAKAFLAAEEKFQKMLEKFEIEIG